MDEGSALGGLAPHTIWAELPWTSPFKRVGRARLYRLWLSRATKAGNLGKERVERRAELRANMKNNPGACIVGTTCEMAHMHGSWGSCSFCDSRARATVRGQKRKIYDIESAQIQTKMCGQNPVPSRVRYAASKKQRMPQPLQ
ncbi:hypothetical protein GGTG_09731 [Gaeumannomyces tritici R3-111a-1]|uniref:Uncharacterized protein n=1 Tax=Gaeumannomyces tritici (strain R3-111a-1) TaxID=644352 RepID=J3P897_GAET3|nr:hypothetical protein GGTG_09731 [Gaeumannomyces tritici R3-111a-1]EJT72880.1 hypothetical protein GGTG_09731 [Gaeumannomyces tritici R3-111a-1]